MFTIISLVSGTHINVTVILVNITLIGYCDSFLITDFFTATTYFSPYTENSE